MIGFLTVLILFYLRFFVRLLHKALRYSSKLSSPPLKYYGSSSSPNHLHFPLVSWLPLLSRVIKINFDSSVKSSIATTAYVIRDYYGSFI